MNFKHLAVLLIIMTIFNGCTISQIKRGVNIATRLPNMKGEDILREAASQTPVLSQAMQVEKLIFKDIKRLLETLSGKWEKKPKIATPKKYVKYSQNYKSRAEVDFENRVITVETIDIKSPKESLKKAIVSTLLTPYDPERVNLHSDKEVELGKEPFLYKQVLDNEHKPIRWNWRAGKFANHLLTYNYQTKTIKTKDGERRLYFVTILMQKAASSIQVERIRPYVLKNAKRFNLSPALILAVIETESSFNPYATSSIPAYGLMQIVPKTAGRDSWRFLKKSDGMPTRSYLFNERNNIEMGAAYLHIVSTKYLHKITNLVSREYCTIAAYNTGSGNVLKTFHRSSRDEAMRIINSMSPSEVYEKLRKSLPYDETRRYIHKVEIAKKRYI